jgi:MFS family permease
MVIYIPIYLHNYIGLPYNVIVGMIIPIALIPFPLFEIFLGRIADKYWGEKEILITGFIIAGFGVMLIPFITSTLWWVWAITLFITRIGASFIELMSESYFYKHVDSRDVSLMSAFRMLRPLSYIFGTIVATAALAILPEFRDLFFVLGIFLLAGVHFSSGLVDTK